MKKLLKMLAELQKKGFATVEEKALVMKEVEGLRAQDADAVEDQVEEVKDLPETDPEAPKEGEEGEGEGDDEELQKSISKMFKKQAGDIKSELTAEIKDFLKEEHEAIKKQVGAYNPDVAAQRKELNNHMREFTKALINGDELRLKEMTTDASGSPYAGYTVDSELSAEIRHLITEYGVARREMEFMALSKGSLDANSLVTDVTVYWVDEGAVVNSTEAVLGQATLTLKKLGAIVSLTSELLEDTEIDLVSFLASRVAEGFAQAEDEAFFDGDGTSNFGGFTGILRDAGVNVVYLGGSSTSGQTSFNNMTAEDLLAMQDATPQGALANAKYYYHRTIKSVIRKLREDAVSAADAAGAFIYQAPSQAGPATVWGVPEVLVEAMPAIGDDAVDTAFVGFGDLKKSSIFGHKGGSISAKRFDAGSVRNVADNADINLITTDREAMRWTMRIGVLHVLPSAFTVLKSAAS